MHPIPHTSQVQATAGELPTTLIEQPASQALCEVALLNRVGLVLRDMAVARAVSDREIRQHALDCAWLMERAYGRFRESGIPADREEALLWMSRQQEALASLSPAWEAARTAQIEHDIATDACYFGARAELDRQTLARRGAGA